MASYKKQHYLPAAYLRNFSVDGERSNRNSKLWRFDARIRKLVSVESQGFADYHYSVASADQVEADFRIGEDFYADCYADFWKRNAPSSARKGFGLLLMMLDLHIRNIAYAKAVRNNHDDYLAMSATVKYKILWGRQETPPDDEAIANEAFRNWRVGFVRCDSSHVFLTSDNPSLLVKIGRSRAFVNVVLMPVTPHTYAVGYDSREFELNPSTLSESDEIVLTRLQIRNCLQCVYACESIRDDEWDGLKKLLAERPPKRLVEGKGLWGADIFQMPAKGALGLVRARKC
ncbi:MAG: DUF4238 domain-containing protein [Opitutaceae bacterium]|nr:DUF4238 domain-containing protein [Cephaloticoccus sp.]MCP5530493.1 DUF4238 domain-containing protein [Opitutaceae bacterium]